MKNIFFNYKAVSMICLAMFCFQGYGQKVNEQSAYETAIRMFNRTKQIESMTYIILKKERIDGKMIEGLTSVKLVRAPFKVYMKQLLPNPGMELMFIKGSNENNILVNPNGFPWFNLNLDPFGSISRNNQHHTIHNSGYDHVISILEFLFNKYDTIIRELVKSRGTINFNGHDCYFIIFENPYFCYHKHTVKKGETLLTIADSLKLSEHMIMEKNQFIDDYDDIMESQLIEIPNDYSPRMELFIDKERMIPLVMKVFDDKGIYEYYEYTDVKINPTLKPQEFSMDYEEYGF